MAAKWTLQNFAIWCVATLAVAYIAGILSDKLQSGLKQV